MHRSWVQELQMEGIRPVNDMPLDLLVAVMMAIHIALELSVRAIVSRRRFRQVCIAEDECGEGSNASIRRIHQWRAILLQQITICRVVLNSEAFATRRAITCPWYIKPRATEWYYLFVDWNPNQDPERFRQFFKISPGMFSEICDLVREDLITETPYVFSTLPNRVLVVERQVAIALRRLAIGDQVLGIAKLFGISKQMASKFTWKFIKSFSFRARKFLSWPTAAEMELVKEGFLDRWNFPNCCGAIDATHFPIEVPVGENATAYYDWKHNLSVTMQAVVDSRCMFLDVVVGCPGSIQDSRLLRMSGLFRQVVYEGTKLVGPEFVSWHGDRIGEYILADVGRDVGYPLYKWMIVPYRKGHSLCTDAWNHAHSLARMCVERAFGKLKGTWRLLSRVILNPKIDRLAPTILCCVLLHNMQIHKGDDIYRNQAEEFPPHPPGYGPFVRSTNQFFFEGGNEAREALLHQLDT